MYVNKIIAIIILFCATAFAGESLTVCYRAYYFIPLGEACITYELDNKSIRISSEMKTNTFASIVKKIEDNGESTFFYKDKRFEFKFYQREGNYRRNHFYSYGFYKFYYKIIKYKKGRKKIREGHFVSPFTFDPYFFVLNLQCAVHKDFYKLFYDKKVYKIKIYKEGNIYSFKPKIETKGLLIPKGEWRLFLSKEKIIEKMYVGFTIGKAKLKAVKIDGDKRLLSKICNILRNSYERY